MASFQKPYSLEKDHIFEGKYQIIRELGSGGFGMVYLAHQIAMDRPVALKILKPGVGAHAPSARERFLREVKIISKLRHPNTVTIHDYGETVHGVVYMVLEYVEGRTLKQLLRQEGAQEPMRALSIARQVVRSLGEAHNHQVVHRDLKPANIMLTELEADTDFVKVLDFGVARLLDTPDADLTSAGVPEGERALIGTPRYMSPEQVRGEQLTGASDLYSLGLMLYEMLIGEPAVQGDTTMGLISQQLSPEPLRLPSLGALPESLQQLLRRATAKNIGQRFRSADEFARAIDETAVALAESYGPRGRSATGAYFAASGRFPAVRRFNPSHAPGHHFQPDSTSAGTPSSIRQHQSDSGHLSFSTSREDAIHVNTPNASSLDYYEKSFDADQLAERSRQPVPSPAFSGASLEIIGNEIEMDEASGLLGIPNSDLPLPPDALDSPFVKNEPEPQLEIQKPLQPPPRAAVDDESSIVFAFKVVKICFLGTLALFFSYLCFVVTGALVGNFVQGAVQVGIASILAISIPLFTALGENSQKERFEVVHKYSDRIARVLLGSSIFSAASAVIMCFAMPGMVADNLRNDPNWAFRANQGVTYEPTPFTEFNREFSGVIADMVEVSTAYIGRYDGTPTSAQGAAPSSTDAVIAPPTPTRPSSRHGAAAEPSSQERPAAETPRPSQRTGPPPTRPRRTPDNEDSDYVRWE